MAREADKQTAMRVVRQLRQAGHEALFAGGCVRDMLLGRRCHDYDVATDATPLQVQAIFRRVLMIGAKFGVAMVLLNDRRGEDRCVEVATFRSDVSYSDGRRPDRVCFSNPKKDAERRDFTINGMFYDPVAREVIDYVGGKADLKRRVIRTIGLADERFAEDYLRLLRAVRFATRLGFSVEAATKRAIRKQAENITRISGERICEEFRKMLTSDSAHDAMTMLETFHLARPILPELFPTGETGKRQPNPWQNSMRQLAKLPRQRRETLSFGALLCELPPRAISAIASRWGASNDWKKGITFLATHRDTWQQARGAPLCEFKRLLASPWWKDLRALWLIRETLATGKTTHCRQLTRRANALDPAQIAPDPLVTGDDLLRMGIKPGKRLGLLLRTLYDAQLNETLTTKKQAMAMAKTQLRGDG